VHRHDVPFHVDTVGNGHGAAAIVAVVRGDRRSLGPLAQGAVPMDPTFAVSASSALAHAAVLTADEVLIARALTWEPAETIPLLRFLSPLNRFHQALAVGDVERAALFAEHYRRAAEPVPVCRIYPRALLNVALLEVGRIGVVELAVDEGTRLLAQMPRAPYLEVQIHLSRAQLAAAVGDAASARDAAGRALAIAADHRFAFAAIDAEELVAVAAHIDGASGAELAELFAGPLALRDALGYRAVMVAPRACYDAALAASAPHRVVSPIRPRKISHSPPTR